MSQLQLRQFPYNFEILSFCRRANYYFLVIQNQNVSNNTLWLFTIWFKGNENISCCSTAQDFPVGSILKI